MSEAVKDLIQQALDADYNKANKIFSDVMTIKVQDVLDQEKVRLADQIYNGAEPEDEDDITDEDIASMDMAQLVHLVDSGDLDMDVMVEVRLPRTCGHALYPCDVRHPLCLLRFVCAFPARRGAFRLTSAWAWLIRCTCLCRQAMDRVAAKKKAQERRQRGAWRGVAIAKIEGGEG